MPGSSVCAPNYTIPNNKRELKLIDLSPYFGYKLYHTKQQKGTKTQARVSQVEARLYHTKQQKGTKTKDNSHVSDGVLYHTKQQKGTKTPNGYIKIHEDYTIPNNKRELKRKFVFVVHIPHYTIPNNKSSRGSF